MKIPDVFIPEKKLDYKVEDLLKEKSLKKLQVNEFEIPYAIQENGDYLVMRNGRLLNTPDNKKIQSADFYFTIDGEEHKLHISKKVNKLDEKFVNIEENLISKLFEFGLLSNNQPEVDVPSYFDYWKSKMKIKTENTYKELSNLLKNRGIT